MLYVYVAINICEIIDKMQKNKILSPQDDVMGGKEAGKEATESASSAEKEDVKEEKQQADNII